MITRNKKRFSRRYGYSSPEKEITIRHDAPEEFRGALLQIGIEQGLEPSDLRKVVCSALRRIPDRNNWSEYPNVWDEVQDLIIECPWFKVYDCAETLYDYLSKNQYPQIAKEFEVSLNDYFRESGIGWQMKNGEIITRGTEAFERSVHKAVDALNESGRPTARNEIHEAIGDISRRPEPDITGAIQHGMASLECVARDICGDPKATLGELLKRYPEKLDLPKPLDESVSKAWGYASEMARHIREGRTPSYEEAELIVGLAAVVGTYLSRKA